MASATKMDVVENDSIRKPKTYVETNRKFKRLTLVNNNNDGKIGLEILLISDRSLLGTNTGGDGDDFADGKKTRKQNRNQTRRTKNLDRMCCPRTIQRTSEKGQKKG